MQLLQAISRPLTSFFEIAPREYASFTFDEGARATARNLIIALCVGIILAAFYAFYQKQVPGAVVRAILRAKAFDPESAKTAEELGLQKNPFLRRELRKNMTLKRIIKVVQPPKSESGEAENTTEEPRYYIPEEMKYRAEVRYENKGNGLFGLIFTIIVTLGLGILLIKTLPAILGLFDYILK